MQKTSAWPLAQAYLVLIVYASLYPFTGWRDQGIMPWIFIAAAWPKYWTWFDVISNVLGYVPVGFLLALSVARRGRRRQSGRTGNAVPMAVAVLATAVLSFTMESLQTYLPSRVPSNLDFVLNFAGGAIGAIVAALLDITGVVDTWSRFRGRWFVDDARGAIVLLALWPVALLFPAAVPFGLGQVSERLEAFLVEWLTDTPFLEWLPVRDVELQPLVPGAELLCVLLGVLIPTLLGFSVLRSVLQRAVCTGLIVLVGVGTTALSAALSWGPSHAWSWLSFPVQLGLGFGLLLSLPPMAVPRRGCAALVLLAGVLHLAMLNQSVASAYFANTLQTWEQGRFIRFNGVAQWLGWVWPYAVLLYVLVRVSRADPPTKLAG